MALVDCTASLSVTSLVIQARIRRDVSRVACSHRADCVVATSVRGGRNGSERPPTRNVARHAGM